MSQFRSSTEPMELEEVSGEFTPIADRRALIPEPLPVRLVAVEDVVLPAASGLERDLQEFYVNLLGFERDSAEIDSLVLHADNQLLRFVVLEPPVSRDSMRTLGIEVASLGEIESRLLGAEIDHARQRGLMPGQESILLRDPAGNWLSLMQTQLIR